ncbi:response regulator [Candidatus Magnetomonas plexicatena]|uniref:response regulator n=1 Tax=Candidatus Magnetomonas plexicatena TaxID=2552947 RepID=UPI001C78FB09|nr:response regulator [Nitrospirales bacterium LBB_01]
MANKLLLVNNSVTILKVVELILSEEDYEVVFVNDGEEALSKLKSFVPDIILADVELPKLGGYELCKQVKANKALKDVPFVLLIGAFEALNEQKIKEVGANDYLFKPFDSKEFLNKIHTYVKPSAAAPAVDMDSGAQDDPQKDEEPIELGETSIMDEKDIDSLFEETHVEETAVFEDSLHDEKDDFQDFTDNDLTTRELKDVLESLTGDDNEDSMGEIQDEPMELDNTSMMSDADIEALLNETMVEETVSFEGDARKLEESQLEELSFDEFDITADITQGAKEGKYNGDDSVSSLFDDLKEGDPDPTQDILGDDIDDIGATEFLDNVDTSLSSEESSEDLQELTGSFFEKNKQLDSETKDTVSYAPKEDRYREIPMDAGLRPQGDVLLTSFDVISILKRSLDHKIDMLFDEGRILSVFQESVNLYVKENFRDISIGLDDRVSEAINRKINDVVGQINLDAIISQVISSTIKGILSNTVSEMFKMTKEITERVIKNTLEENIPTLREEVEKVIWETVPQMAEKLIKIEIEQIKSEFM